MLFYGLGKKDKMPVKFYIDHNVSMHVVKALRKLSIDLITAYEDNKDNVPDIEIIERAIELKRLIFTQDVKILSFALLISGNLILIIMRKNGS